MSDILERAKAHFLDRLDAGKKCIDVPEWGTKIHYNPMTLEEENQIYKYVRDGSLESLVMTLIVRARHSDGKRMFTKANRLELMKEVDPQIIQRIVAEMNRDEDVDPEDVRKNSGKMPTSSSSTG